MFSYLRGKLVETGKNYVILDVNGVGYRVNISTKALNILAKDGGEINLFTRVLLDQREGDFEIFGFLKKEDSDLFDSLISISGIGPRKAMNILSSIDRDKLLAAVVNENTGYLNNVAGLGPKTSKRLIIELKDKITKDEFALLAKLDLVQENEAVDALIALGYQKNYALEALAKVSKKAKDTEGKVREALRILSTGIK